MRKAVIRRVVLVALGVACLLVGVLSVTLFKPRAVRLIESATVLDEPRCLPENEGKVVIVKGSITAKTQLREPIFGFTLDAPAVEVTTETYRYDKNTTRYTPGAGKWVWGQESGSVYTAPATLGEFEPDTALLVLMPTPVSVTAEDVAGQLPSAYFTDENAGMTYFPPRASRTSHKRTVPSTAVPSATATPFRERARPIPSSVGRKTDASSWSRRSEPPPSASVSSMPRG